MRIVYPLPHAGWVETTYVDDAGWRVGRGDKGSIFVTARIPDKDSAEENS